MNRIYHNYTLWEDYLNGMWNKVNKVDEQILLQKAILFTSDHIQYGNAMMDVVKLWKFTMEHNLTDNSINHKAFVGHCAVSYKLNIPEYITRMAWGNLTERQQYLANKQAEKAIKYWKSNHLKLKYVNKELFD